MALLLSSELARALDPQDLKICQDSDDIPRMIAACTNLARDTALPTGARSMAELKRGFGNFALGNFDAAAADFSEAISLNPKNHFAHHELGLTLFKKGDPGRAIASLTEAIRLDPAGAASRVSRGQIYLSQDRLQEAIQDFTAAIDLGADKNTVFAKDQAMNRPDSARVTAEYYYARALAYYQPGDFKAAVSDFDRASELFDRDGYHVIWAAVSSIRDGSPDADGRLSARLAKDPLEAWPRIVAELLIGRTSPAAALAAAKDPAQVCEAHYYTAIVRLRAKDQAAARQEFVAARDGCPQSEREYAAAIADLKRLQSQ